MIGQDQIAESVRNADAVSEERGLEALCRERGVDLEGLSYVAMQRGLRGVMALRGDDPNMPHGGVVATSPAERRIQMTLAAAFMDGFLARDGIRENGSLPWSVGRHDTATLFGRFATHDDAATFIGTLPDHEQGIYYLDGPERP